MPLSALSQDVVQQHVKHGIGYISVASIKAAVCEHYDVSINDLLSQRRQRDLTLPRHIAMFLARDLTKLSFPQIARLFDRDHSTVLHACRRVEDQAIRDRHLAVAVAMIAARLVEPDQHILPLE